MITLQALQQSSDYAPSFCLSLWFKNLGFHLFKKCLKFHIWREILGGSGKKREQAFLKFLISYGTRQVVVFMCSPMKPNFHHCHEVGKPQDSGRS